MLALLDGKKRVKGTAGKDVSYVGSIQQDGYIYFGDDILYRTPTPTNLTTTTAIPINYVQIFYVQKKQWFRSNFFTNLTVIGFDSAEILRKIQEAKDEAIQAIQDAADAARATLDLDGHVRDNGDALNMAAIIINDIVPVVNREHNTSIPPFNHTIYR